MSDRKRVSELDFDQRSRSGIFGPRKRARRLTSTISGDVLEDGVERVVANERQLIHQLCSHQALSMFQPREFNDFIDNCEIVRCGGGTVMAQVGAHASSVFFVLEGLVRLQARTSTGIFHDLRECGNHSVFGIDAVFDQGTYAYRARAVRNTAAIRFQADGLRRIIQSNSPLGARMLYVLCNALNEQLWDATE
ncbi:MAG TPA: hypothetical protein DCQ06_07025, partial [Myxococcales bacterium]|nr:hypothetical protein [Myxococcales bacterium]